MDAVLYRYGWPAHCRPVVFGLGKPVGSADLERFLDIAERRSAFHPAARFLIVTEGSPLAVIESLLRRARLRGQVGVLGYCAHHDPRRTALIALSGRHAVA